MRILIVVCVCLSLFGALSVRSPLILAQAITSEVPWPKYVRGASLSSEPTNANASNGFALPENSKPFAQLSFDATRHLNATERIIIYVEAEGPKKTGVTAPTRFILLWRVDLPDGRRFTLAELRAGNLGMHQFPNVLCGIVCEPDPDLTQQQLARAVAQSGGLALISNYFQSLDINSGDHKTLRDLMVAKLKT